jgi:RNA polymerase sigma factor (sigma-70 family)
VWSLRSSAMDADADAVARCRAGEEAAFEELVRRHEGEVYRIAMRMLGHREDALDAVQDTFLRVHRGLPRFRGEATFRTWVYGIALNVCRNRLTSRERRDRRRTTSLSRVGSDEDPLELPLPDGAPGPDRVAYGSELRAALERALADLSAGHREALVLREIEGLEYEEMARVLSCRLGTVKSRLARARAALAKALEGVWP